MLPSTAPALDYTQTPGIIHDMDALFRMQAGVNKLVTAMRPTLGPLPRAVAIERALRGRSPELLDSGGTIARRIVDLPEKSENVGAMMVRGMVWRLQELVGDGTVTAALIFQSLYNDGVRYLAAGGNPALLRESLECAAELALARLDTMRTTLQGQAQLTGAALAICGDEDLAVMLGESFHLLGEYGSFEVRGGQRGESNQEYVQGSYWSGTLVGTESPITRIERDDAALLISDLALDDPQSLVPLLRTAAAEQIRYLFVITPQVSDKVLALARQSQRTEGLHIYPLRVTETQAGTMHWVLEDIAALIGAQVLLGAAGYTWQDVHAGHIGGARRIWADKHNIGIMGGNADPHILRQVVQRLRETHARSKDKAIREATLVRIGKLMGGSVVMNTGGYTESELQALQNTAERSATALRAGLRSGVVPGGGVALLNCRSAVDDLARNAETSDVRAACQMLQNALAAPFRALLENAGISPGVLMADMAQAGEGFGCDIRSGTILDMRAAGIVDVAEVQRAALQYAVQSAALALTVNTIVHRRKPPVMNTPDGMGV